MKTFRSNGKLLITAEYAVLDGAKALAIPTKYGQSLSVKVNDTNKIHWTSYDEYNSIWFHDVFELQNNNITSQKGNDPISKRLIDIFYAVKKLNPNFFNNENGFRVTTHQDFNRHWGLGTSSTLINNMASWAKVNAYELLELTFGGSGYDIACAQNSTPIIYQRETMFNPRIEVADFDPSFSSHLYFVYLEQKQNSREEIKSYKNRDTLDASMFSTINSLTVKVIEAKSIEDFNKHIKEHENIISILIGQEPIKSRLFSDFQGTIKSLGAWGGDFVLVSSRTDPSEYFNEKGYHTVIPYSQMVLK